MNYVMLRCWKLENGDDSMFFVEAGGTKACIINGKEGVNNPSNTKPVFESDDTQAVIWEYMHQDGIIKPDDFGEDDDDIEERFEFIDRKSVQDSDGFYTDYTMYYDVVEDKYVFVFGDSDIYRPEDGDYDWECDSESEAWEWFNSYNGVGDDMDESFEKDEYQERVEEIATEIVQELYDRFNDLGFYNEMEFNGGLLLLFDGLDKYDADEHEAISAFLNNYPGVDIKFAGDKLKVFVK